MRLAVLLATMMAVLIASVALGSYDPGAWWDGVDGTHTTEDASGRTVYYRRRLDSVTKPVGSDISAATYYRVDGSATNAKEHAIFVEITDDNTEFATALNIAHSGGTDAIYIANFGGGIGVETAGFKSGSRGIASTLQWESPDTTAHDFRYSTLYAGVWGYETGPNAGSKTPPAYGMVYLHKSLGRAIYIKAQDPAEDGYVADPIEIVISDYAGRNKTTLTQNAGLDLRGRAATAAATTRNDAFSRVTSSYWSGAASVDKSAKTGVSVTAAGAATYQVKIGTKGSETTQFAVSAGGNPTFGGTTLRVSTQRTIASSATAGNTGEFCANDTYLYYRGTTRWYRLAWNAAAW